MRSDLASADQVAQLLVRDVGDVVIAAVDTVGAVRILLDAAHAVADLGFLNREGQADIAKSDNADGCGFVFDPADENLPDGYGVAHCVLLMLRWGFGISELRERRRRGRGSAMSRGTSRSDGKAGGYS